MATYCTDEQLKRRLIDNFNRRIVKNHNQWILDYHNYYFKNKQEYIDYIDKFYTPKPKKKGKRLELINL